MILTFSGSRGGTLEIAGVRYTDTGEARPFVPVAATEVFARGASDGVFRRWTSGPCEGATRSRCVLPPGTTEVGAQFEPVRPSCPTTPLTAECELASYPGGSVAVGRAQGETDGSVVPAMTHTLSGYLLDVAEVTVGRYSQFLFSTGAANAVRVEYPAGQLVTAEAAAPGTRQPSVPAGESPLTYGSITGADPSLPVNGVSWHDAQAFCAFDGGRLPTDVEWEAAAHAPNTTYPWGDGPATCALALFGYAGATPCPDPRGPARPGTRPKARGLFDMAGNLSEWIGDGWPAASGAPTFECNRGKTDLVCTSGMDFHPIRGGDWFYDTVGCGIAHPCPSSARRNRLAASERHANVGFRCAHSAEELTITRSGTEVQIVVASAGIDCTGTTCIGAALRGRPATITLPNLGGRSVQWGGACTGVMAPTCTVVLHGPETVTVNILP